MSVKRVRVSLTLPYIEGVDRLIQKGIYENRPEVVKDALQRLFKHYNLDVLKV